MQNIKGQLPTSVYYSYLFGNAVLNFLNWLWFYKMIKALRKRFTSSKPSQHPGANGAGNRHADAT